MPDKLDGDTSKKPGVSRLKKLEARGVEVQMPPVNAGYLLEYLWDIGPTKSNGMDRSEIEHPDVESFQRNMGIELCPWEIRTLIRLSREYASESSNAARPDHPAPWRPERYNTYSADVARSLEAQMDRLMNL